MINSKCDELEKNLPNVRITLKGDLMFSAIIAGRFSDVGSVTTSSLL